MLPLKMKANGPFPAGRIEDAGDAANSSGHRTRVSPVQRSEDHDEELVIRSGCRRIINRAGALRASRRPRTKERTEKTAAGGPAGNSNRMPDGRARLVQAGDSGRGTGRCKRTCNPDEAQEPYGKSHRD